LWGWAPGVNKLTLPPVTGFRAGNDAGSIKMLYLQVHYNNPNLVPNLFDQSSIILRYTPQLRQYDAGVLVLGDWGLTLPSIGAGLPSVPFETTCSPACTSLLPHAVNVFGDVLHEHQIGSQAYTTQWRNGSYFGTMNRIDFWSFDLQQTTSHNNNMTIQPGDRINLHCIYNAQTRATKTIFGPSSEDEMCLDFVYYYPKVLNFNYCGYIRDTQSDTSYSLCSLDPNGIINERNPIRDPVDMTAILFGLDDGKCVAPTSSTTGSSTTESHMSSSSTLQHSLFLLLVICAMLF